MAAQRMTLAILAKRVEEFSDRFDRRFETFRAEISAHLETRLEQFAERIELSFKVSLEGMERKLDAALDRTKEQKRRLDAFESQNQREHRLMQTQITELDAQLQSRRRRGRPS